MMKTLTLEDAILEAVQAHMGQTDKRGEPYILHPLRVMLAVLSDAKIVAVLHDALEDTDIDATYLAQRMNTTDFEALSLLTRQVDDTYEDYIERIATAHSTAGDIAREVKAADLQDNLGRMNAGTASLGPRYLRALSRLFATGEGE